MESAPHRAEAGSDNGFPLVGHILYFPPRLEKSYSSGLKLGLPSFLADLEAPYLKLKPKGTSATFLSDNDECFRCF